jgi:hypothetical protein
LKKEEWIIVDINLAKHQYLKIKTLFFNFLVVIFAISLPIIIMKVLFWILILLEIKPID